MAKTKINKARIKRAIRPPGNAVVMSMMAVILVCAAPALVSVIDDTYTYEGTSEIQLLDSPIPVHKGSYIRAPEAEMGYAAASYIPASENDGTFVIAVNDPLVTANDVSRARFFGIDMTPLTSGIGDIKVVTTCDATEVFLGFFNEEDSGSISLIRSESDPSVWTGSLSSVDLVKFRSGVYDYISVDIVGQNELFDMQIFAVGEYVIPYGEIIIGATGVLLMVCALLATPWYGLSGYTGRRITRRR